MIMTSCTSPNTSSLEGILNRWVKKQFGFAIVCDVEIDSKNFIAQAIMTSRRSN